MSRATGPAAVLFAAAAGCASVLGFEDAKPAPTCNGDQDCAPAFRCLATSTGGGTAPQAGSCVAGLSCVTVGQQCSGDGCECPQGLVCASDHQCRSACTSNPGQTNAQCLLRQVCTLAVGGTAMGVCVGTDPAHDPLAGAGDGGSGDGGLGDGDGGGDASIFDITHLADVGGTVDDLVVDDHFVYWIENGGATLRAMSSTGGSTTILVGAAQLRGLVQDPAFGVYFGNGSQIQHCPAGLTSCTPSPVASGGVGQVWSLARQASTLFFKDSQNGNVGRCNESGCGTTPQVFATGQNGPGAITVTPTGLNVYWTNANAGSVLGCDPSNCMATQRTIAGPSAGRPTSIVADAAQVYWSNGQAIFHCDGSAGCGTAQLPGSAGTVGALALDTTNLYWIDAGGARILKCDKATCGTVRVVVALAAPRAPRALTLDATSVYYTTTDGKLEKVPK